MSADELRALVSMLPPMPESDGDERASVFFAAVFAADD